MRAFKYTLWIVTRNQDHHYPVLMSNNGKMVLNEPVGRAAKLERSWDRLKDAIWAYDVATVRITEKDFKAKFPRFAPNAGGKKAAKKTTKKR